MKKYILKIFIAVLLLTPSLSQAISVYTNDSTNVTETTATLNGGANLFLDGCSANTMYSATTGLPCAVSTTIPKVTGYFRYSKSDIAPIFCNDIYGSSMISTGDKDLGINRAILTFSQGIDGLTPNTKYYYCAIVSDKDNIVYGGKNIVKSFTTKPLKTTVKTSDATRITSTSATLNGSYNAVKSISTYFKYRATKLTLPTLGNTNNGCPVGWTGDYPSCTASWVTVGKQEHNKGSYSSINGNINYSLSGLEPSTQYSFMVDTNDTEAVHIPSISNLKTFTTSAKTGEVIGNGTGTCYDGIRNGNETGVDTGGRCGGWVNIDGTCYDNIQNGDETGVDTGGRCDNWINTNGTCYDNTQNGDETGIDTGGRCNGWVNTDGTCYDNIQNGNETGVDTGGRCGGFINVDGNCYDGIQNGDETGIDTGGRCNGWVNTDGTCYDRIRNGNETGVDVGGRCGGFINVDGNCYDAVRNGNETGVDTGGRCGKSDTWGTSTDNNNGIINTTPLTLGQHINPPSLAIVRYHEGIETVFARQIVADIAFARLYGYTDGIDIQIFAGDLAHLFAKMFGYVDKNGREIRVSFPDIAAYQLQLIGNQLTVYEYYNNIIVDLRNVTTDFKNASNYEYYWKR